MSFHFLIRFDPPPEKAAEFRNALLSAIGPTRAEGGCVSIQAFETMREPVTFAIHSEWLNEAAFDLHSRLTHTVQFVSAAERLLGHPVEGLRLCPIKSNVNGELP